MKIRVATVADGAAIYDIYSHYIATSTATFEITQLSPDIMEGRIAATLPQFPYLVYQSEGQILGYCYATRFGSREGFDYDAELAIYIRQGWNGRGVGEALYKKILTLLKHQGICNVFAVITAENEGSIRFHQRMGFSPFGRSQRVGRKFGQWVGICWMDYRLIDTDAPTPVIPFSKLNKEIIEEVLKEEG